MATAIACAIDALYIRNGSKVARGAVFTFPGDSVFVFLLLDMSVTGLQEHGQYHKIMPCAVYLRVLCVSVTIILYPVKCCESTWIALCLAKTG
jgi:hypothetical protein